MIKLKIHLTANKRDLVSKAGKPFSLVEGYVFLPNVPYPAKIDFFDPKLPAGHYDVPASFEVFGGRVQLNFDFTKASQSEAK